MATVVPKFQYIPNLIDIKIGNYTIPAGNWAIVGLASNGIQTYSTYVIGQNFVNQQIYVKEGTVLAYSEAFNSGGAGITCFAGSFAATSVVLSAYTKLFINGGSYFLGFNISTTSFAACVGAAGITFQGGATYYSYATGTYCVQLFTV